MCLCLAGNPTKRRSYDSVDPLFEDGLPSSSELKNFYVTFDKYFKLNARWSEKKKVPSIGESTFFSLLSASNNYLKRKYSCKHRLDIFLPIHRHKGFHTR